MPATTKKGNKATGSCPVCEVDSDEPMIECSTCLQWIHFRCANLSNTKVKKIGDDDWYCASCLVVEPDATSIEKQPDIESAADCIARLTAMLNKQMDAREESLKIHQEQSMLMAQRLGDVQEQLGRVLRKEPVTPEQSKQEQVEVKTQQESGAVAKPKKGQEEAKPEWKLLVDEQMRRFQELEKREAEVKLFNDELLRGAFREETPEPVDRPLNRTYEPKRPTQGFEKLGAILARPSLTKLKPFSGDVREWGCFKQNYEETSHLGEFNELENKRRLEEALVGSARELVRHHLMTSSKGSDIMKVLNERYGRPESLVIAYLQPWLDHPSVDRTIDAKLYTFAVEGQQAVANIKTIGDSKLLDQEYVLIQLIKKLERVSFYHQWMERKESDRKLNLEDFANFLMEKAKRLPTSVLDAATAVKSSKPTDGRAIMMHAQAATRQQVSPKRHQCFQCGKAHGLWKCDEFRNLPINERWNLVKQKRICSGCLRANDHFQESCPDKRQCNFTDCERFHNKLLHSKGREVEADHGEPLLQPEAQEFVPQPRPVNHHGSAEETLFKVVPLIVFDKKGKAVETHALLDGGSSASLIDKEFLTELGLSGRDEKLILQWTKGITREENSTCISVRVQASKGGRRYELNNVFSVEELDLPTQSRDAVELGKRFKHLRGLPISNLKNARATILIGLDHAKLLVETKTHQGGDYEPLASKTPLGWVVWGRPNNTVSVRSFLHSARTTSFMLHDIGRNKDQALHNLSGCYVQEMTNKACRNPTIEKGRERDNYECGFQDIVKENQRIFELNQQFKSENLMLSIENEKRRNGLGFSDLTAVARIQALEKKMMERQDELIEMHKRNGNSQQMIIDLYVKVTELQNQLETKNNSLIEQQKMNSSLQAEVHRLFASINKMKNLDVTLPDKHTALHRLDCSFESSLHNTQTYLIQTHSRAQHMVDKYIKRWLTEYLQEMKRRSKWHQNKRCMRIDDIVIMIEPQQSQREWRRGRVVQVYPEPDGIVRSADVMFERPKHQAQ